MVAKVSDLANLPDWPRLLSPEQAAKYCGMSTPFFQEICPVEPWRVGAGRSHRRVLYDRKKLDAWIDGGQSGTSTGSNVEGCF